MHILRDVLLLFVNLRFSAHTKRSPDNARHLPNNYPKMSLIPIFHLQFGTYILHSYKPFTHTCSKLYIARSYQKSEGSAYNQAALHSLGRSHYTSQWYIIPENLLYGILNGDPFFRKFNGAQWDRCNLTSLLISHVPHVYVAVGFTYVRYCAHMPLFNANQLRGYKE